MNKKTSLELKQELSQIDILKKIGFSLKNNTDNSYIKKYQNHEIVNINEKKK